MTTPSTLAVRVDPRLCEGHALCLQLAPEVFHLGEDEIASCVAIRICEELREEDSP
jgi:ferredoxin